jgi:hypothetical protein
VNPPAGVTTYTLARTAIYAGNVTLSYPLVTERW